LTTGNSQFVEKVTGKTGLRKASPATKVSELRVSLPEFPGTEICFIETPGFDDSEEIYIDIFKMISEWLKQLYVLSTFPVSPLPFYISGTTKVAI